MRIFYTYTVLVGCRGINVVGVRERVGMKLSGRRVPTTFIYIAIIYLNKCLGGVELMICLFFESRSSGGKGLTWSSWRFYLVPSFGMIEDHL